MRRRDFGNSQFIARMSAQGDQYIVLRRRSRGNAEVMLSERAKAAQPPSRRSEPPKQHKNDDDDQDEADDTDATMTVAVAVATEAATEAAEQENDEQDDEDGSEHDLISLGWTCPKMTSSERTHRTLGRLSPVPQLTPGNYFLSMEIPRSPMLISIPVDFCRSW
jgi:hypothetical protein